MTPPRAAASATARRLMTGGVAALLLTAMCASTAPASASPPDRATLTRMDEVIREGMERSGMPGFAVAVVSGDDVLHTRGFGDAGDGRRVTPQTPFLLGSTSKSFTALAAMQLVDAGRLDLDAAARRYVPEFRLADQSAADRITVRQVLQQTSGLPATAGGAIVRSAADGSTLDAVRELRDTTLATPPGSAFEYSNANYILAGLIVERASGEPYGQYIQRHIFTPLGMRRSFVALDAAERAGLATGHRFWFGLSVAHGPTFRHGIQSAGYLISSARTWGGISPCTSTTASAPTGSASCRAAGSRPCSPRDARGRWARGRIVPTPGTRWAGTSAGPGQSPPSSIPGARPTRPP